MKFQFKKTEAPPHIDSASWTEWTWHARESLTSEADFAAFFDLTESERQALTSENRFPVRATPYYTALASRTNVEDPIRRMILPRLEERTARGQQIPDPLGERRHSPLERLVHRYPDRVLFLITDQCSLYCRYCLRKHFTGQGEAFIGSKEYEQALSYLRLNRGIREVILSGGDPLTLSDGRLERVLSDLRAIEHLEIIRIASRMPVVLPMRMTDDLARLFKRFKPVLFMTHFNHPRELSLEAATALERLVDHGVPVFNQMVLLNGINNHPALVQALSRRLLYLRVKPYYLFQCDPSEGTEHFRTSVEESEAIQRELWGRLSGLAMPNLSLDIPGGGGKVGLTPNFESHRAEGVRHYVGFDGKAGTYEPPVATSKTPSDLENYLAEWELLKGQGYGTEPT